MHLSGNLKNILCFLKRVHLPISPISALSTNLVPRVYTVFYIYFWFFFLRDRGCCSTTKQSLAMLCLCVSCWIGLPGRLGSYQNLKFTDIKCPKEIFFYFANGTLKFQNKPKMRKLTPYCHDWDNNFVNTENDWKDKGRLKWLKR